MSILSSITGALGLSGPIKSGYGQAAGAIQTAIPEATGAIKTGLEQATGTLQPFTSFGASVLPSLQKLMQDPSSVTQTPQYQFQLSEGLRGLTQGGGALGKYLSGQTLRGITNYSQGLAANTYNQQFQNLANLYNIGQQGATTLAGMQTGAGGALAQTYMGGGADLASLYASQGRDIASQNQAMFNTLAGIGQTYATGGYGGGKLFGV